jgi:uncharacterized protein with HEPN domain
MRRDDAIRLQHMLEAARYALSFIAGKDRSDLDSDKMLVLALVKSIEIIGEAASKVSLEGRATWAGLPWQDIVAMRNRLIHAYFDINLDIVWSTLTQDLPPLVAELEKALSS